MVGLVSSLSVVVPATDQPPTLARCLAALRRATTSDDEIVVVTDPDLNVSEARNAGVRRSTGDIVVFVDSDVEVARDAIERLRRRLDERPEIDAVFGSYDATPGHPGLVSSFRNLLHHHVHQTSGGPAETFWTGLGAIRRTSFARAGGFDASRYGRPSIEDIEFGQRVVDTGGAIELDPAAQGTHLKVWTIRSMLWTDFARRGVPWVALQIRRRRLMGSLNLGWRHRFTAVGFVVAAIAAVSLATVPLAVAVGTVLGLNRDFYLVLARHSGPLRAALGVGLHGLHHLAAVASVPAGVAAALWSLRPAPSPAAEPALVPE